MRSPARTGAEILAADLLEGDRVFDRAGGHVGVIADLMIDVERGAVAYALVATAPETGLGERLLAVPWGAMRLMAGHEGFVLEADPARLAHAPAFDRDDVPSMGDDRWGQQVHAFYGVEPYWRPALLGSGAGGPGAFGL